MFAIHTRAQSSVTGVTGFTHSGSAKPSIHDDFRASQPLPSLSLLPSHGPGHASSLISLFVMQQVVTVKVHASTTTAMRFKLGTESLPGHNPVDETIARAQGNAACVRVLERQSYSLSITVSVLFVSCVVEQALRLGPAGAALPLHAGSRQTPALPAPPTAPVARAPKLPSPQPVETPESVRLKPVDASKRTMPSDWDASLNVRQKANRYDVWNWLNEARAPWIDVEREGRDNKRVKPQAIAPNGLSFTGVDDSNRAEQFAFADVRRLTRAEA